MKKQWINGVLGIAGILVAIGGLYLLKTANSPSGVMLALPYVCIGIGSGMFGHGMGAYLEKKTYENNPQLQKQIEVEQQDERNIAIDNRAKAKAYDATLWVISALLICFVLMGVDLIPVLLLVAVDIFIIGYRIFYLVKYQKQG